jgi:hypothetical protein
LRHYFAFQQTNSVSRIMEYGPQYISTPPPPHRHTLFVYTVHWEGEEGGGGQREGTVEGQQYTRKVPSSMGATVHKLGRKYQPMSECISSL